MAFDLGFADNALRLARTFVAICVLIGPASVSMAGLPELRVVSSAFPGVFETSPTGEIGGFGVEVLSALCADIGCAPRFQQYPFLRALAMVGRGEADVSIGVYRTAEREAMVSFSALPLFQDEIVFYGRADGNTVWNGDYATLGTVKVGAFHGWFYGKAFERAVNDRTFVPLMSYSLEEGLKQLDAGKVDVLASNRRNTDPLVVRMGLNGRLVPLTPSIGRESAWLIFPRTPQGDEWRTKVDAAFARLVKSGKLASLARRYGVQLPAFKN